jgi:hypothetical protein
VSGINLFETGLLKHVQMHGLGIHKFPNDARGFIEPHDCLIVTEAFLSEGSQMFVGLLRCIVRGGDDIRVFELVKGR